MSAVAGRWDTYLLQIVDNPLPNVDQALVIVGSNKRGTIYGIYDLSEQIGVSQMHVVMDMHQRKRRFFEDTDAIVALPGGCGTLEELLEAITEVHRGGSPMRSAFRACPKSSARHLSARPS